MFEKFDNDTICVVAIGIALIAGVVTKQSDIVQGAICALAGFTTGKVTAK